MGFFKKLKFWRKRKERVELKEHIEILENIMQELLKILEKKDREREEVEVTLQGRIRELEEQIAAKGGEMDTAQEEHLEEALPGNMDECTQEELQGTPEERSSEEAEPGNMDESTEEDKQQGTPEEGSLEQALPENIDDLFQEAPVRNKYVYYAVAVGVLVAAGWWFLSYILFV
jgi:hypothetical protein